MNKELFDKGLAIRKSEALAIANGTVYGLAAGVWIETSGADVPNPFIIR